MGITLKAFLTSIHIGSLGYFTTYGAQIAYLKFLLDTKDERFEQPYNKYLDNNVGKGIFTGCVIDESSPSRLQSYPDSRKLCLALRDTARKHAETFVINHDHPFYAGAASALLSVSYCFFRSKKEETHEQVEQGLVIKRQLHHRFMAIGMKKEAPEEFYDPLYCTLMDHPIKTSSNGGNYKKTYDATTLAALKRPLKCPYTRTPLIALGPDLALKQRIEAYVSKKEKQVERKKEAFNRKI